MLQIRAAERGDLPELFAISAFDDYDAVQAWLKDQLQARLPLWVLEEERQVAGWIGLEPAPLPYATTTAQVQIYVAQPGRRKGYGSRLLAHALAGAAAEHIDTLLGTVVRSNTPLLRFFARHHFGRWGRLPRVARVETRYRDIVILGRSVARPCAGDRLEQLSNDAANWRWGARL